jgi:alpha-L-fucosidase
MNDMVFQLQPEIIVNNRNGLTGDFSTPEQQIRPEQGDRDWETCMTMGECFGYNRADDNLITPKTIVLNLISCARDRGNYLLNVGPTGDGSIPEPAVRNLIAVGNWTSKYGQTIYGVPKCNARNSAFASFTRNGNTLYLHMRMWPGSSFGLGGLSTKVRSAKLLPSGTKVEFRQADFRVEFTGLPERSPEKLVSVIEVECESEPKQDVLAEIGEKRPRPGKA